MRVTGAATWYMIFGSWMHDFAMGRVLPLEFRPSMYRQLLVLYPSQLSFMVSSVTFVEVGNTECD